MPSYAPTCPQKLIFPPIFSDKTCSFPNGRSVRIFFNLISPIEFSSLKRRKIQADFNGGKSTHKFPSGYVFFISHDFSFNLRIDTM